MQSHQHSNKRAPLSDITDLVKDAQNFSQMRMLESNFKGSESKFSTLIVNHLRKEFESYTVSSKNKIDYQLRVKLVHWLAEIIFKKNKTLATFDKTINMYDRLSEIQAIETKNCQQYFLACFDIIQRFGEVTYVDQSEIVKWISLNGKPYLVE